MTQQEKSSGQGASGADINLVSRKVHKADREKLRRDKLNEQFAELATVLDSEKPKLDKASILGDTLQAVRDLRSEIKRLKVERGSLFDESRDLKRENFDLEEEKAALQKQTDDLEVQVQHVLKAAMTLGSNGPFQQPIPAQAQQPGFGYVSAAPLSSSNPFIYLTSPSSVQHVERPSARYPAANGVPDFLSKVQQQQGFRALVPEREEESDTQLQLGQPRSSAGGDKVDTDLQLNVPATRAASK